jgi:hypothetical protein
MKKLISTLAISTLLSIQSNANHLESDFKLRAFNYQPITVQIDQINYGNPTSEFIINEITPGRHRLTVWSVPANKNYRGNHSPELLYNGFVDLNPQTSTMAVVTHNHRLKITGIEPKYLPVAYNSCNQNSGYHPSNPSNCNTSFTPHGMYPPQFEQLKSSIACKNFDSTRLLLARQAVRNNQMTSNQVAQLISLLDFESSKMDLAKFAYTYTIDPQNYYVIYNEFSFESSVVELSNYMDRHS